MIKRLMFIGPPGAGKGTLAELVEKEEGLKHVSTGAIFRDNIKRKTALGVKVQHILDAGAYVDDSITNEIVQDALDRPTVLKNGFILDGFPRTINQAMFLKDGDMNVDKVVLINITDQELIKRLLGRGRKDDNLETIKARIKIYDEETKPLIDFYRKEKKLVEIDGNGSIEDNYRNLMRVIKND